MALTVLTPLGGDRKLSTSTNFYVGSRVLGSIVTDNSRVLDGSASKDLSPVRATWPGLAVGFSDGVNVLAPIKKYEPRQQIPQSVWMSLGLPSRGTRLHDLIREGLPFELLDRIASLLQVQQGAISKAICMSPTTLARRAKVGRFNTLESDRLVTMISVFEEALSPTSLYLVAPAARSECAPLASLQPNGRFPQMSCMVAGETSL